MAGVFRIELKRPDLESGGLTITPHPSVLVPPLGFEPRSCPNLEPYAGYKPVALTVMLEGHKRQVLFRGNMEELVRNQLYLFMYRWNIAKPPLRLFNFGSL